MWNVLARKINVLDDLEMEKQILEAYTEWTKKTLMPALADAIIRGHEYIIKRLYTKAMAESLLSSWQFENGKQELEQWVLRRAEMNIKSMTAAQIKVMRRELNYWAVFRNKPVERVASAIAKSVGLLPAQQEALIKLRESMRAAGVSERLVKNAAERYRYYAKKQRALLIARTEIARAYQEGKRQTILKAIDNGTISGATKTWLTAEDERVCSICEPLGREENNPIKMNEQFSGGYDAPPAHPRCRCDVIYAEEA